MTTVDFRCEQCGKLLTVEATADGTTTCPQCKNTVAIPSGLANLPRPHVPGEPAARPAAPPPLPGQAPAAQAVAVEAVEELPAEEEELSVPVLAGPLGAVLPWVMSLFLHLGIVLILLFIYSAAKPIIENKPKPKPMVNAINQSSMNFTTNAGGSPIDPGVGDDAEEVTSPNGAIDDTGLSQDPGALDLGQGAGTGDDMRIGSGGGGKGGAGPLAKRGRGTGSGRGNGPRIGFGGSWGHNAYHVVYVIDRSGSMRAGGVWDDVKKKMLESISSLNEQQDFHVIFFAEGEPTQLTLPGKGPGLLPVNDVNKTAAIKFILGLPTPRGSTDPIAALEAAAKVLNGVKDGRGKLVFMLTDGFASLSDTKPLLDRIKQLKKADAQFVVNTLLYGDEDGSRKRLQEIADETDGRFLRISK